MNTVSYTRCQLCEKVLPLSNLKRDKTGWVCTDMKICEHQKSKKEAIKKMQNIEVDITEYP